MENKEKAHCFSGISKSPAGPVYPFNVRQVKAHTHILENIAIFCPPAHEQAFNLSHLGQKHADLFTCQ